MEIDSLKCVANVMSSDSSTQLLRYGVDSVTYEKDETFHLRSIIVLVSNLPSRALKNSWVSKKNKDSALIMIAPPMMDAVTHKSISKIQTYHKWRIFSEWQHYRGSRAGYAGFILPCQTAIFTSPKVSYAVSGCWDESPVQFRLFLDSVSRRFSEALNGSRQ